MTESLDDIVKAVQAEQAAPVEPEKPVEAAPVEESPAPVEAAPEADAEQPKAEADAEAETPAKEGEKPEEPAPVEAPTHWGAADREMFGKLSREGQEFLQRRHREMEADYTKKTMELGEVRSFKRDVDSALSDVMPTLEQHRIAPATFIGNLVRAQQAIAKDPAAGLAQLMAAEKITLDQLAEASERLADPNVRRALDAESRLAALERQMRQSSSTSAQDQIEQFVSAIDPTTGRAAHPHFAKVRESMGRLMVSGQAGSLDQAYKLAVRLDDDLAAEAQAAAVQAQLQTTLKAREDAQKAEQKAHAARARAAAGVTRPSAPAVPGQPNASDIAAITRDTMRELGFQFST